MTGLRLRLISWWTPHWFYHYILKELTISTVQGLSSLLKNRDHKHKYPALKGSLEHKRSIMAYIHNQLVKEVIDSYGYKNGVKLGKDTMYEVGILLGHRFKKILGVDDSLEDLILAAKLLYHGLGIEFNIIEKDKTPILVVDLCALSRFYAPETCMIMSGADEGVVKGLNPHIKMEFKQRITEGSSTCRAKLKMGDGII